MSDENEIKICKVEGCNKPTKKSDRYCSMHRARLSRTGSLELKPRPSIKERLETNIQIDESYCWNWQGYLNPRGYGRMRIKGGK